MQLFIKLFFYKMQIIKFKTFAEPICFYPSTPGQLMLG